MELFCVGCGSCLISIPASDGGTSTPTLVYIIYTLVPQYRDEPLHEMICSQGSHSFWKKRKSRSFPGVFQSNFRIFQVLSVASQFAAEMYKMRDVHR